MPVLKSLLSIVSLAAVAASLAACVVENDGPRHYHHDYDHDHDPAPASPPSSSSSSSSGSTAEPVDPAPASTAAMLVVVDSNQTMNAQPGEGVGVFVEYNTGGHWHVWWTCDTNQGDHQSCDFSVSISAASGNIANIDATELAGGLYSAPTSSRLEARSTTSTEVKGFRFDTDAGAVITLEATLASAQGDIKDGSFLFFVQDGKVNGGFTGKLTNPLRLQGNVP